MPLAIHVVLCAFATAMLAGQLFARQRSRRHIVLISTALAAAMASGLWLMAMQGGLAYSLFFGHVMHWVGWLAVLTWLHAIARRGDRMAAPRVGLPLLLTVAACAAGLLALVQERI